MKGNRYLGAVLASVMILCVPLSALASDNVVTESIGNLTYEIPADWVVLPQDENDEAITQIIIAGQTAMFVSYIPVDLDLSEMPYGLQKLFVDKATDSYEDYLDNYTEIENEDCLFKDYAANVRSFFFDSD